MYSRANQNMPELTQRQLRRILNYNLKTGTITYRVKRGKIRAGSIAGCLRPDGYRVIGIDYRLYRASRLIYFYMTGRWPKGRGEVDHINGIPDDNRWSNLRHATHLQNMRNRSIRTNKNTPYKGVSWHKRYRKYQTYIVVNGRFIWLGYFTNPKKAHEAYVKAARTYFGRFARAK